MRTILAILFISSAASIGTGQTPNLFGMTTITSPASSLGMSPTMGIMDEGQFPYISTVSLGWIYVDETSTPERIHFWQEQLGWVYSRTEIFPTVYLYKYGEWVLLDLTDASQTKYFSFNSRRWHYLKINMY